MPVKNVQRNEDEIYRRLPFNAQNPLHTFSRNLTGKLPTCYGFVTDFLATRPTSPHPQQVRSKLATSLCNGIWEQHDTTHTTNFCPHQLVTDLLRGNWCDGFWP